MRAVGVHEDVVVLRSAVWQTSCIAVRGDDEAFVIDSPVLPGELEALPEVLAQARFSVAGLVATHADWDHLLGPLAFPEAPLGVGDATAQRLASEPGRAQRELRWFDEDHYVQRPRPLSLGAVQELPVPGRLDVGSYELELLAAEGHTADGTAVHIPWAGVLCPGDYLSPVEIPWICDGGSRATYLATLRRLAPIVDACEHVVPGHGAVLDPARAAAILREDVAYLESLPGGALPIARRSAHQRAIHAENLERL